MANFLNFFPRSIVPRGVQKDPVLSREKVKELIFDDDFEHIQKITPLRHQFLTTPTLFYPGCGCDILTPLLFIERLFPQLSKINLLFVDVKDNFDLITTILDDINISFSQDQRRISFYWNDFLVSLEFLLEDVFVMPLPSFDIYFERSFRIMKDIDPQYETKIYNKLNQNGLLISDSGFQNCTIQNIPFPPELSIYQEMIAGIKKMGSSLL